MAALARDRPNKAMEAIHSRDMEATLSSTLSKATEDTRLKGTAPGTVADTASHSAELAVVWVLVEERFSEPVQV